MKKEKKNKIIVFVDGGARGNPGPSACGFLICNEKEEILKKYKFSLGIKTNNEAEYWGVILALRKIKTLFGKKRSKNLEIEIRTDSQLLYSQLEGKYKILDQKLQSLFIKIWNLKVDFKNVKFKFIKREENKIADSLVKEVLFSNRKLF